MATTFEYMSDWVSHFQGILNNELRDEIENRNLIKGFIVESNEPFMKFVKKLQNSKHIPSKESEFHNLIIKSMNESYEFYIDTLDPRFWVIHSIEPHDSMGQLVNTIFTGNLLQDNLYLSRERREAYYKKFNATSAGFSLSFEQLFNSGKKSAFHEKPDVMTTAGFTLRLWQKGKQDASAQLEALRKANLPITYKSSNFVLTEDEQVLVKEDLSYEGLFPLNRGNNFKAHLNFIYGIREDYAETMKYVEANIIDWEKCTGGIFLFEFVNEINPQTFAEILFRTHVKKKFRIAGFKMHSIMIR